MNDKTKSNSNRNRNGKIEKIHCKLTNEFGKTEQARSIGDKVSPKKMEFKQWHCNKQSERIQEQIVQHQRGKKYEKLDGQVMRKRLLELILEKQSSKINKNVKFNLPQDKVDCQSIGPVKNEFAEKELENIIKWNNSNLKYKLTFKGSLKLTSDRARTSNLSQNKCSLVLNNVQNCTKIMFSCWKKSEEQSLKNIHCIQRSANRTMNHLEKTFQSILNKISNNSNFERFINSSHSPLRMNKFQK